MVVQTSRKLVLTYKPHDGGKNPNLEMKFAEGVAGMFESESVPGRILPLTVIEADYAEHIQKTCNTLNKELAKLVDNAEFHIVEVKIIK